MNPREGVRDKEFLRRYGDDIAGGALCFIFLSGVDSGLLFIISEDEDAGSLSVAHRV